MPGSVPCVAISPLKAQGQREGQDTSILFYSSSSIRPTLTSKSSVNIASKILDKEISSEQYGVGFKKGNTELKDQVQKTLDEMKEDGTIDEIAAKYESYGVPGSLI